MPQSDESVAALHAAMSLPLPPLSREARLRIEQGEKDAKARYEQDTEPQWPTSPSFSFLPADVYRSLSQILEHIRIYAERVLDVHLKEYLECYPEELIMNMGLRVQLTDAILKLTNHLWDGYRTTLWHEPIVRSARYGGNRAAGIPNQSADLEPWRYPNTKAWAEFRRQARQPDF